MVGYLIGYIKSLFQKGISIRSLVNVNCCISKKAVVYQLARLNNVQLGDYSYIGRGDIIRNTTIGKFCSISDYCVFGLPPHNMKSISTSPLFNSPKNGTQHKWVEVSSYSPPPMHIEIGNDVWIGYRVMIPSSVKIGNGAVIAAGAVVTKDVPDFAIVGGVPAKVIKYRFSPEIIAKLREIKWWEWEDERIIKYLPIFSKETITMEELEHLY